jgi:hypothetical protein
VAQDRFFGPKTDFSRPLGMKFSEKLSKKLQIYAKKHHNILDFRLRRIGRNRRFSQIRRENKGRESACSATYYGDTYLGHVKEHESPGNNGSDNRKQLTLVTDDPRDAE